MTAQVTIYSSNLCGYCFRAKRLLDSKGLSYEEISVDGRQDVRQQMMQLTGNRTGPTSPSPVRRHQPPVLAGYWQC